MRRVMYLFLPNWPIDRLRRLRSIPSLGAGAPADEPPFATVIAAGGQRLIAAVNPAAADAWSNLGIALNRTQRFSAALAAHERALALRPGNPEILKSM